MNRLLSHVRKLVAVEDARSLSDRALLQRFIDHGNEAAFAALVDRHAPLILAACRRLLSREQDAEDVVQATFLVLVRKAGSIRRHESVGSWLYGVACRIARKLRASEARRTRRERIVAEAQATAVPLRTWDDLGAVLDEELGRLPHQYRAPVLLCCLQGKTRDEAAHELGWAPGAVKIRLERGRELIRSRLARRGIAPSVVFLATSVASANVSVRAVARIVEVSTRYAAGQTVDAPIAQKLATVLLHEQLAAKVVGISGAFFAVGFGALWLALTPGPTRLRFENPAASTSSGAPAVVIEQRQKPSSQPDETPVPHPERDAAASLVASLRSVDPTTQTVTLRAREVNTTYALTADAEIQIDGQSASFEDLARLNSRTRIRAALSAGGNEVTRLVAEGETVLGVLHAVDGNRNTIALQRSTTDSKGMPVTWLISPSVAVTLDGKITTLASLREGHAASVRVSADGKRVLALEAKSR